MDITTYGLDIAKRVFQMYWVEAESGELMNRRFTRDALIEFLANRAAGRVAFEACGSAHWWARKVISLGHEPVLLHATFIRPFVQNNKTDAADARAIWTAAQQPGMRTVATKTEDQQAILALHRVRALLIKMRTMQTNQLRGLLYEFGMTFKAGRQAGLAEIRLRMAELESGLPGLLLQPLQSQLKRLDGLNEEIVALEKQIDRWQKNDAACQANSAIPGIGKLTATALVATIGNANSFRSGREFSSFIGLVPRQRGTGGKVKLLGISKRGDSYLRMLMIHGARSVLFTAKEKCAWTEDMLKRRPPNVVVTALANKIARTVWAILAHARTYQKDYVSISPS